MNFIDDYITTEYNIFLAELKSEKKNQVSSTIGADETTQQTVVTPKPPKPGTSSGEGY